MVQIALLFYGFLGTFILSGSARNRREGRRNPAMMVYVSWFMRGITIGLVLGFLLYAAMGWPMDLSSLDFGMTEAA